MNQLLSFLIAIIFMAPSNQDINQLKTKNEMTKVEKENIEKLLNKYKKALNTSDPILAQSLFTEDGIFMPAGAPSAIGAESIKKSYEFIFTQIQLNIEFFIDEILVEGDLAFATSTSTSKTMIKVTGETVPEENRELFVFEKIDGDWKIARYMFNKTK